MATYETSDSTRAETATARPTTSREGRLRRNGRTRETKPSFMTSEFWIYLLAVAGVLIASYEVGSEDGHDDYFTADRAWTLIVVLTVGYLLSRGVAKAGSADHPDRDRS